jgi:probable phosphoglycerate mutase
MTELLFIRHGETAWNREQRFQGHRDVPLNELGHLQARRLAERLAADPHDALYCSDLTRARETAAPLAVAWAQRPIPMVELREQNFGLFEGLDHATVTARHPELWQSWLEHRADFALPGGESRREFHARVLLAVRELARSAPGRRLAVVTHGGVLDILWRSACGLSLDGVRACEIPNTGVNRLRWAGGTLHVEQWGDAGHLAGLPTDPATAAGEALAASAAPRPQGR